MHVEKRSMYKQVSTVVVVLPDMKNPRLIGLHDS